LPLSFYKTFGFILKVDSEALGFSTMARFVDCLICLEGENRGKKSLTYEDILYILRRFQKIDDPFSQFPAQAAAIYISP
jgi:hypothetical protein